MVLSGSRAIASSSPQTQIPITAQDINKNNTFTITRPGYYLLTDDVNWDAPDANARAIAIASDNVTLDLGGRRSHT